MDLNEIKEIIEQDGGKFIIVEDGKPVMVVLSFEDYKSRLKGQKALLPREENQARAIPKPMPKELADEELKIDDLPL